MGEGWGEGYLEKQKIEGQEGRLVSFIDELVKLVKDLLMIIA